MLGLNLGAHRPVKFPTGLDPVQVARRIVQAIADGETDLPSSAFAPLSIVTNLERLAQSTSVNIDTEPQWAFLMRCFCNCSSKNQ